MALPERDPIPMRGPSSAHCIILVYVKAPFELDQDLIQAGVLLGLALMRRSMGGIDQDSQSKHITTLRYRRTFSECASMHVLVYYKLDGSET